MTYSGILKFATALAFFFFLQSCEEEIDLPTTQNPESGSIITIAGQGPDEFDHEGDGGLAVAASLGWVVDVSIDNNNNIYIVDGAANTIRIVTRQDGIINTVAGAFMGFNVGGDLYQGDGGLATEAHLNVCLKVAIDQFQNIMITDNGNHVIRQINGVTGIISTAVGSYPGALGFTGDGSIATEAQVANPQGIVFDSEGNLFFTDTQNHVIRRVSKDTGIITTIAGLGPGEAGYSGDGGVAIESRLNSPAGLAIDNQDDLYFSDRGNHVIRKISNGVITTIAGNGLEGNTGDGAAPLSASILAVNGVAVDNSGNVYITSGNTIRKVDQALGIISTIAGNGSEGYSGDGGPAVNAQLANPWGVAVDSDGNIYIADSGNSAVRMVIK